MKLHLNRRATVRVAAGLLIAALVLPGSLLADAIPGKWTLIEELDAGSEITVQLKAGDRVDGRFLGLDPSSIRISSGTAERVYPREAVDRIEAIVNQNGSKTLTGAVAGGAVGGVFGGLLGNSFSEHDRSRDILVGSLIFGGIGAGIGALVGFGASEVHSTRKVLYRAP